MAQVLISKATTRACRLLDSFDELRWEVWDSTLRRNHTIPQMEQDERVPHDWKDIAERTLNSAARFQVAEVELTEEFRNARAEVDEVGNMKSYERRLSDWYYYKRDRLRRNEWATYFSSNLEWDWDLAESLRRLYKLDSPGSSACRQCPAADVLFGEVVGVQSRTWNVKSGAAETELPKEVRIEYRTEAGEVQYITFVPKSSEPSLGSMGSSDGPETVVVQDFVTQPKNCQQSLIPY